MSYPSGTMPETPSQDAENASKALIAAGVGGVVLTVILVVAAIILAANAQTAGPFVEVVRDVLIIVLALELVIMGAAIVVFLVQLARFLNLLNNEIQPIVASTKDTVNVLRGTAIFLSRHVSEPVIGIAGALGGLAATLRDIDAIRKAMGGFGERGDAA
jgi:hypothetical protein